MKERLENGVYGDAHKHEQGTQEWLDARAKCFTTSSNMGPLMLQDGCYDWSNPLRFIRYLLDPVKYPRPVPSATAVQIMNYGSQFESKAVFSMFERLTDIQVYEFWNPGLLKTEIRNKVHGTSLDGIIEFTRGGEMQFAAIECKIPYPFPGRGCSQARKEGVPHKEYLQVQHQMLVTGNHETFYVVWFPDTDTHLVTVVRPDLPLVKAMLDYIDLVGHLIDCPENWIFGEWLHPHYRHAGMKKQIWLDVAEVDALVKEMKRSERDLLQPDWFITQETLYRLK